MRTPATRPPFVTTASTSTLLPAAEAGRRLAARPVAAALAGALDNWVFMRRSMAPPDTAVVGRLMAVARVADPDPWRNRVRDAIGLKDEDRTKSLDALRGLAREADVQTLPVVSSHRLAQALWELGDRETAIPLLRTVQQVHPGDFWVNSDLGTYLRQVGPASAGEAVTFLTAAVAIQPAGPRGPAQARRHARLAGPHGRGNRCVSPGFASIPPTPLSATAWSRSCSSQKFFDQALAIYNDGLRHSPGDPDPRIKFGWALANQGATDQAFEVFREAVRVHPEHAYSHASLARILMRRGQQDEALAQVCEARRLGPDAETHHSIALVLKDVGRLGEAIEIGGKPSGSRPGVSYFHNNLAFALELQEKLDEAAATYREAIRLDPDFAEPHLNLGHVLRRKHEYAESLAEYRRGHELGVKKPGRSLPSAEWVRQAERFARLGSRLTAVLRGRHHPSSPAERSTSRRWRTTPRTIVYRPASSEKHCVSRRTWPRTGPPSVSTTPPAPPRWRWPPQGGGGRPPAGRGAGPPCGNKLDWLRAESPRGRVSSGLVNRSPGIRSDGLRALESGPRTWPTSAAPMLWPGWDGRAGGVAGLLGRGRLLTEEEQSGRQPLRRPCAIRSQDSPGGPRPSRSPCLALPGEAATSSPTTSAWASDSPGMAHDPWGPNPRDTTTGWPGACTRFPHARGHS